jgi:hypothetical protein
MFGTSILIYEVNIILSVGAGAIVHLVSGDLDQVATG